MYLPGPRGRSSGWSPGYGFWPREGPLEQVVLVGDSGSFTGLRDFLELGFGVVGSFARVFVSAFFIFFEAFLGLQWCCSHISRVLC